jgi:hypothetical protein
MRRFCTFVLLSCLLLSCTRSADQHTGIIDASAAETGTTDTRPAVPPMAIPPLAVLQAGEHPLWFQFTDGGPVLIEAIEDACFSAALIPWPLAPHVRSILARGEELLMAVNRDGFICLAPWQGRDTNNAERVGLYRISGGEFWRQYTVTAFVMFDEKPAALLYQDDRFLESKAPLPSPRLWTFDLFTTGLEAMNIPSLGAFAPEDGWDIDTLRRGTDGRWYFRAVKKTAAPEIRMLRSEDLVQSGEQVSLGPFQNSALPEQLPAAPESLRNMLAAVFAQSGCSIASVVSPEFQSARYFAADREKAPSGEGDSIFGFYLGGVNSGDTFFVATQSRGASLYVGADSSVRRFSLPPLPEGFVYTGIGMTGNTLVAAWEEQEGYSIGASGFMVIRL